MAYPNGQEIWDYFKPIFDNNEYGVAGLMGNLYAESGLLPFRLQGDYGAPNYTVSHEYTADVNDGTYTEYQFVNDSKGYGLAQWTTSGRKQGLYTLCLGGTYYGIDSLTKQMEYIVDELNGSYVGVLDVLMNSASLWECSTKVLTDYESPQDQSYAVKLQRWQYSRDIYNTYSGQPPIPPTPPIPPSQRRKMPLYMYTLRQARYKKGIL